MRLVAGNSTRMSVAEEASAISCTSKSSPLRCAADSKSMCLQQVGLRGVTTIVVERATMEGKEEVAKVTTTVVVAAAMMSAGPSVVTVTVTAMAVAVSAGPSVVTGNHAGAMRGDGMRGGETAAQRGMVQHQPPREELHQHLQAMLHLQDHHPRVMHLQDHHLQMAPHLQVKHHPSIRLDVIISTSLRKRLAMCLDLGRCVGFHIANQLNPKTKVVFHG